MKAASLLILLLFVSYAEASPNEKISHKEIYVGDEIGYEIDFDSGIPSTLKLEEGDHSIDATELPVLRIWNVHRKDKSISLSVRFYKAGSFRLPIYWEEEGEKKTTELVFEVKSRLTGNESDIEDIAPPISFSGSYLLRLLFVIFIFLILLYISYAVYLKLKNSKQILDATWERVPVLESRQIKLIQIESALKQNEISYKEFAYLVSSYIKEEFSRRLASDLLHLTDSEFLNYLYDRSHLEIESTKEIKDILASSKYTNHSKILSKEEAEQLWQDWKRKLKL